MKETILIERPIPGLAVVKLNRYEQDNAYDDEMVCTLITAFDDLMEDDSLKLIWLTAVGENFCRGPDIEWVRRRQHSGRAEHQQDAEQLSRLFQTLYEFPIPIMVTVRGMANAAAVGVLCCCDIVLAAERAHFTITETRHGQVPALQSPYLVKTLGERATRYYSLSAESMDAYTATRLGLVNKIVPENELDSMADLLIQRMLSRKGLSLRQTKAMISLSANEPFDESLVETLIDCSTDIRLSQSIDADTTV
ncbi:enoyl-CoA hydratase-related protein [Reinekea blandensis]|uniref:Putative enoyl-CoA hydratase/isomerase n=1 Tax=Reinekea blandensis MED297 TaxID=314283 RepID=A4BDR7_9GAMM|nr:enoyl-CoA hydratase-related protein [Reinekea blandensis]EAR09676.1 putative enoyl-CoA hydratase/isomerase [Reinekea blandensis MED297]